MVLHPPLVQNGVAKAFKTFTAQTRFRVFEFGAEQGFESYKPGTAGWQLPTMVHSMHSRSTVLQRTEQYKNLSSRIRLHLV
ncbi:hypothetical protein EMCRGX_G024777 [Ephydatia muelleri]